MLSIKRHLDETVSVGQQLLVTVKELWHGCAVLLVQTADTRMTLWLHRGEAINFGDGQIRIRMGMVSPARCRLQVEAPGLAIGWSKFPPAPPAPPPPPPDDPAGCEPAAGNLSNVAATTPTVGSFRARVMSELSLAWLCLRLWWSCADETVGGL